MLSYVIKLRILISEYAFRLATRVPKPVRRRLKTLGAISLGFNFVKDDAYRVRHAFNLLKARQARELEAMAASTKIEAESGIHLVIDATAASFPQVSETVSSVLKQISSASRVTLFVKETNTIEKLCKSFPDLDRGLFAVVHSVFGVAKALREASRRQLGAPEYVLFLKAGDVLNRYAITAFECFIDSGEYPDALYSDVTTMVGDKPVVECRPEFCPDYLYEYNYLPSSICFKSDLLLGLSLPEVEGTEGVEAINHALAIHMSRNQGISIQHIPYVLLENVATVTPERPISQLARESLTLIGKEQGFKVRQGLSKETLCVQWEMAGLHPLVSIIIPTRDQVDLLRQCIDSILEKSSYQNIELLVVNNNSEKSETYDYFSSLAGDCRIKIIDYPYEFNYSAINNFAVTKASGDFIALVNNDIEVISPDWLEIMVSQCARPDVGCVGAKLYYPDDTCQHGGVVIGYGGVAGHAHKNFDRSSKGYMCRLITTQNFTAVTAACLLIRKETFLKVGGFDEENLTVAFNDIDLCLKVHNLGLRNIWTPHAELYHHESVSRGSDRRGAARNRFMSEIEYMKKRWRTHEFKDPAYNVNLTLSREDFALKTY